ncbi:hypothetical protein C1645_876847 [Glomus cerebriforme]|uniref:F-box domain-containing protein n=1 Tax=Glomus cerebriforme TaxID=658196 RepID=A0A397SZ18_9GLOM|nr:hypothetical protein C1645_876847 [Glomus cerebriforme]
MPLQLPVDCLDEILEYLEENYLTLHSCLLVNRLWCEIAVRILWRNVWNFQYNIDNSYRTHVPLAIISTLISCLPNESKDLLNKNGIFISTPTSKSPLFNYPSFTKVLSINKFNTMVHYVLKDKKSVTSLSLDYNKHLIEQEIIKMFMNQITSLKKLKYHGNNSHFTYFPGAKDCLTNLSELCCDSEVESHFFYRLSQICRNLQLLSIEFRNIVSNGLVELISKQNNLKCLNLFSYRTIAGKRSIKTVLTNLFNPLINKLKMDEGIDITNSFFTNLRELDLSFEHKTSFQELENVIFSNLQILKIKHSKDEIFLIKFFENNGNNLKELIMDGIEGSLGLSIAKFCPNLLKISSILTDDGLATLKIIFNNCQYLESIEIWYDFLSSQSSEKEILEVVVKYSPKNFYELKLYEMSSVLLPEDLESFFKSWKNRIPKKSLNFLINIRNKFLNKNNKPLGVSKEIMRVIEKYKKLGIVVPKIPY